MRSYKVGLLYCAPDQKLENDWFGNCEGSPAFDVCFFIFFFFVLLHCFEFVFFFEIKAFCALLGDEIKLKGWTGYRAGLDVIKVCF